MESKAFDRSVSMAQKTLLLSTIFFYSPIIKRRQCYAPKLFLKPRFIFKPQIPKICFQKDFTVVLQISFLNTLRQQVEYLWVYDDNKAD